MKMLAKLTAVLIFLVVAFTVMFKPTELLAGELQTGTEKEFQEFITDLKRVSEGSKPEIESNIGQLADGFVIVGFDGPSVWDTCMTNHQINKPAGKCGSGACVCLCDEETLCKKEAQCLTFPKISYITAEDSVGGYNAGGDHPTFEGKSSLVFYGDACGTGNFGMRRMKMTKVNETLNVEIIG